MFTKWNLLLDSIADGILMLDKDGHMIYCNPMVTQITGYEEHELLNQSFSKLNDEVADAIKTEYALNMAFRTGRFAAEGWKSHKAQGRFWGQAILAPVFDDAQQFQGYSCVLRDNNEKKKEEISLRHSEERYRLMVEGVKDYSIFLLDTEGHIVTWNDGGKYIQGYSASEITGKHFSIFYTSDDLASKKPEMELRIARQTGMYQEEGWRVKKNGSVFWASIVLTALYNEHNVLIGFSKVTRDLSERQKNAESLRESEERYRSIVEQVSDYGIFMMDEKGRIVSWNEGAKRIKGYDAKEIIGKYFSIFYQEEDILNGKPAYELTVARAVGKYEEEGWRLRKDGERFWANIVITAIYNTSRNLIGFSKVTRDLTERKKTEQALKESYQSSRQLAEELTATNAELSAANQELEQFTSIVSHDLQEPVRTLKSFLQLMNMKLDQGQFQDLKTYLEKSIHAANRMKGLITNLLDYSQISKNELVKENIKITELIDYTLQNLKASIDASKAEITVAIDPATQCIDADRIQLVQLLQNLLSNALKYTDDKVPQITIRCKAENGYVKFQVTDNGIGIDHNDLNKVFDVFRRLHTVKDYPGTGMGLAIAKKVVERHQGRIWLESEPGKGTTFYFTIRES
ncbi:histidine kinase [Dyadobacter sediminis]|uniref:histidine kinase n=1 Tax=Dyadobacter sediminis TaxID=1493691 RepID=A0A5R9KBS0_9BACT|nr:PAS domain S-box protein [Dyadobacter sediminis]GGB95965.1 histidine kinase [Dyadobacter sediminis]